jgi:four helix bundle protein
MPSEGEVWFDHEKLDVYQESIQFIAWATSLLEREVRFGDIKDQIERASASIVLNIAEGNGKFSPRDRCRFFDTAHGSTLECAAALDVLVARRRATREEVQAGKARLQHIVRMLMGLIKRNSDRGYGRDEATD